MTAANCGEVTNNAAPPAAGGLSLVANVAEAETVGDIHHARATEFVAVVMLNNRFTGEENFELVFQKQD